jgi:hypothetical protein
MVRTVRLCVLAGLSFSAAMITADASAADAYAQSCPPWLDWACHDSAASNKATRKTANTSIKGVRKKKQVSQATGAAAGKPKQTQALNPARAARNGKPHPMNDQEKEVLFEQFLEWEKGLRQKTETNR